MSRVEKTEEIKSAAAQIKDEVIETLDDNKKKPHGRFSCFFLSLFLVGGFVLFLLWQVAATGLFTIPLLTSFVYSEAKPMHAVNVGIPAEQLSESFFKTTLTKRLQAGGGELKDRAVTLELPESSLTATLQNELKKTNFEFIDASRAQIAVLPGQILELFLPIKIKNHATALSVQFTLIADKGVFDLKLVQVKLGSFNVPSAFVASLAQPFVNRELTTLNNALSSYVQVNEITTHDVFLRIAGVFTVQVKK